MHFSAHFAQGIKDQRPQILMIRTTLYDLIAAISAEVPADEENLITAAMVHVLKARRVIHLGTFKYRQLVVRPRRASRRHRGKFPVTRASVTGDEWHR